MMTCEALAYHRGDLVARWGDYTALGRMMIARGAFSTGADYVQAARVRRVAQQALAAVFERVDVIATPTAAVGAPTTEDMSTTRRMTGLFSTVFTGYWDAMGNPVLVVPMGPSESGMPLSLQLGGRPFEEAGLLKLGDAYQRVTDWHLQVPVVAAAAMSA
jgi:aspartyl-tRNA(Asn)/glutamyl-tRNA(Gln) amidotransferase subunit A